ncbi:DUF2251 domain-containing protein [Sulfurirhabdus autotrophica]|uniref:DUF2251 domain-containing protein n=1 Tax=Sulfurirhabdus autotrophica TaxID=1706046 RepID=A0A4V2W0P4_9PROT|nr:DUF2251 domain-containing protein [Sulfurirhabdus autotrophica]TCV78216.1 hypothetical protein EDC63_1435 [Sulfurirhabdus autotrophica]
MATNEIFDSAVRSDGDLAGVFEYDGESGYFYLYKTEGGQGHKIIDSIHILSGEPDFTEADVLVRWDTEEEKVGFFIRGVLWAIFDSHDYTGHGGNYRPDAKPGLLPEVVRGFGIVL